MDRTTSCADKIAAVSVAVQTVKANQPGVTDPAPRVQTQAQGDTALSMQAQPEHAGNEAQVTATPALHAASASAGAAATAAVSSDAATDIARLREQAERGDVQAQTELGWRYSHGLGVEWNVGRGMGLITEAAWHGHAEAQYKLGWMVSYAGGVGKSPQRAFKMFRAAAEQGHASAQFELGMRYLQGGVNKDLTQAAKWFGEAAKQGHADAQYSFGLRYLKGQGVEKDVDQAVKWLSNAAEQGVRDAHYALSHMYFKGHDVERDVEKALKHLLLSAVSREGGIVGLQLKSSAIDDDLAAVIASRLQGDAAIVSLDLEKSNIGDEGAAMLAEMLVQNTALQELLLIDNPIGETGLKAIANALSSNTTLRGFDFARTYRNNKTVKEEEESKAIFTQREAIYTQCAANRHIATLLDIQKKWQVSASWSGLGQDLMSLLEQSLIRTDIKLGHSPHVSYPTRQRLLELQLCLSRMGDQYSAVPLGPLDEDGAAQKPSSAAR